jgi:enoyl-CoA hydratase
MPAPVLCETSDGVTTITLNRPEVGNLVSNAMAEAIAAMLDQAYASQVVVLRGAGKDFCLGREFKPPAPHSGVTALDVRRNAEPVLALYAAFRRVPVPVIGIVNGGAIGLGCALVASCDITLASRDARFQLPEMGHGIPPCLAMSSMLARVPRAAILRMVYSMDALTAEEAHIIGLVGQVVSVADLTATADRLVKLIHGYPPAAVQAVKDYLRSAPDMDVQGAMDLARNLYSTVMSSRWATPPKH